MSLFSCCFWWFVFGVLVGWLLSWLLNRLFGKNDAPPSSPPAAPPPAPLAPPVAPTVTPPVTPPVAPAPLATVNLSGESAASFAANQTVPMSAAAAHTADATVQLAQPAGVEATIATAAAGYAATVAMKAPVVPATLINGVDVVAAAAAGFRVAGQDDLKIVEGIGPKIDALLKEHGIRTFSDLQKASVAEISAILDKGGPRFKLANPGSWSEQAGLCARNAWAELRVLQDELVAGVAATDDDIGKA
jgi:predicted flap endonuclease-1-like 5' DNA nuclease